VYLSKWKWENICVSGIKRICRRDRNWYALHSSNLAGAPYDISPRWIDISLLTITSKRLTGCEALLMCQSYRFIVKWIVLLNSLLSSLTEVRVNVQTKSLWSVSACNKSYFFFQLHTVVKLFFNDVAISKPSTDANFNQKTASGGRWRPQALSSTNLWNKLRDKILIEICECVRWTEFAKPSVCIILVALVYFESAKIYTGPKIVRVLKRLRNTGIECFPTVSSCPSLSAGLRELSTCRH